jgi:hypothetical protein
MSLQSYLAETPYGGGARQLRVAAQGACDPVGVLSPKAGEQDLAPAAEDEGVFGVWNLLQSLALGARKRTHEERFPQTDQRSTSLRTYPENALGRAGRGTRASASLL